MVRTMTACGGRTRETATGDVATATGRPTGMNPLERLVQIMRRNEELMGRLEGLGRRLSQARAYADDPASNPSLATALVEHARAGYAAVLEQLRANRVEALGILRACGHTEAG